MDNWGSIESKTISDSRMLREDLFHNAWQPIWYCGTRFQYVYPPALRYGTVLINLVTGASIARAYHIYIGLVYAAGIAGVYWLVLLGSASRSQAWFGAIMSALLSPALFLMKDFRRDSPSWVPQRLHVLMSYGEGAHVSSVAFLGFALAVSFVALRRGNPKLVVLAGVLCAGVVSHNFYGAIGLSLLFPILAWSVYLETRARQVWQRAGVIVLIGYGLCAVWLTPSYVRMTRENLQWVTLPKTAWSGVIAIVSIAGFAALTWWMATRQTRRDAWPIFLVGATSILSVYVLGAYYFGYTVAGNGLRLVPEFDVIAVLLVACVIAQAWKHPMLRSGIIVLLFAACFPASKYLRHAWTIFPRAKSVTSRCEYTLAKWMHLNRPAARALPSGSVRFWYDAWDDNAQALGASEEGMLNQNLPAANWAITQGIDPAPAIQWLQALGVDAIIVPFKTSQEIFHDYAHPEKFQGVLDVLYDDRKGNVIYRVPRRNAAIARIVDRKTILSTSPQAIDRYASVVEHDAGARLTMQRRDFNAVDIDATVAEGQSLLFQETFDRAWHAFSGGQPLTIERDPLGFMLVSLTPGPHQIQLRFETPLEVRVGWLISAVTVLASIGALWRR